MNVRLPLLPAWIRWTLVACVTGLVFYGSILAAPPETGLDAAKPELLPLDKWRHVLAYAAFGATLAYATVDWHLKRRHAAALVLGATIVYGVGIEAWQAFIPGRGFSVVDAYANALGAVLVSPWYLTRPYLEFEPIADWIGGVSRT